MRSLYVFALVLTLASTAQNSHSQLMRDGKPITGPNIGSAQGFTAQLWITEHEEFFHQFAQGGNVKFDGTTHVRRNVPAFLTFFMTDPGLDASGAAEFTGGI